ncbi:MAG: hypothetical protein V1781_01015 [Bacteroidota bacterium]
MKIIFINRNDTKISHLAEGIYIRPLILAADWVRYISITGFSMIYNKMIEGLTEKHIIQLHESVFKNNEDVMSLHKEIDEILSIVKKIRNIKHKNKKDIIALEQYKLVIKSFRENIKGMLENILKETQMYELIPFVQDGIFEVDKMQFYAKESEEEDPYIYWISDIIIANENMFLFSKEVEDIFRFSQIDSQDNTETDFIKIPLWDFPLLFNLNYNQMKYTRENLQSVFHPFIVHLKEFLKDVSEITFSPENFSLFKKLFTSKLNPVIAPIQKPIDENIYISQCRNQLPNDLNTKLCMGITSVENLVNYYEKMEVVFPYVANEIKEQLSRQINLKQAYPFFYFEITLPKTNETREAMYTEFLKTHSTDIQNN